MRLCILTIALPNGSSHTHRLKPHNLARRCATIIRKFAASHGVSPMAVDYETAWVRT